MIKKDNIYIPLASKKIVEEMPAIFKEIRKSGLPSYLVIKKLKGKLGYGVFLHPKAQAIPRGTPIAPYSGKVRIRPQNLELPSPEDDSDYVFTLLSDLQLTREEQQKWDPSRAYHPKRLYAVEVDALNTGNFTRFINHSEKPNVEAHFVKIPSNKKGLSPAPFELIYVAKKAIHPGEQLLICYEGEGKSYWGAMKIKPFPMTPTTFHLDSRGRLVT